MTIGNALKRTRLVRGITQSEVSQRSGVSKSTISRIEGGTRNPSWDMVVNLCQAMKVPLSLVASIYETDWSEL